MCKACVVQDMWLDLHRTHETSPLLARHIIMWVFSKQGKSRVHVIRSLCKWQGKMTWGLKIPALLWRVTRWRCAEKGSCFMSAVNVWYVRTHHTLVPERWYWTFACECVCWQMRWVFSRCAASNSKKTARQKFSLNQLISILSKYTVLVYSPAHSFSIGHLDKLSESNCVLHILSLQWRCFSIRWILFTW